MTDPNHDIPTAHGGAPAEGTPAETAWYGEVTQPGWAGTTPSATQPIPQLPSGAPATATSPAAGPQPGRSHRLAELTAVAVLAALLASGGTYAATRVESSAPQTPSTATSSSNPGRGSGSSGPVVPVAGSAPDWTATATAVTPSVVSIGVQTGQGGAEGSGVILDTKGHVLTNNHVVAGANQVQVTLSDGRTYAAQIKGTDPSTDLAVVTVTSPPADLKPITVGDSDKLAVGAPVMAVGNPLGLASTVTTGIVSALNRPVITTASEGQSDPFGQQQQSSSRVVTNAIQTSAAINPGNSGGALVDATGALVGINSSIASLSSGGGQSGSIGIGFAIPVREAKAIADQLISTGTAQHAYLGVGLKDGTASDGNATLSGAEITQVEAGAPAASAGIKVGDLVIAVDAEPIVSGDALIGSIRERTVGDTVKVTLIRGGKRMDVETKLATRPTTS